MKVLSFCWYIINPPQNHGVSKATWQSVVQCHHKQPLPTEITWFFSIFTPHFHFGLLFRVFLLLDWLPAKANELNLWRANFFQGGRNIFFTPFLLVPNSSVFILPWGGQELDLADRSYKLHRLIKAFYRLTMLILVSHSSNVSFTKWKAKPYYEDKKPWLRKIAQNQYRELSDGEESEKEYRRNRYWNMSVCLFVCFFVLYPLLIPMKGVRTKALSLRRQTIKEYGKECRKIGSRN